MAIITISRMFGSGGSEIAERVAQTLDWELLDNQVVDAVAARLGTDRAEVAARDERPPSLVERLARTMALSSQDWVAPVADAPMPPSEDRMVEMTKRVVDEAIARGPAVVVGRGAQSMLAAREDAIHVFCYSPRAALVRRVMEREDVAEHVAAKMVDDTNKQREEWVRRHWSRSWRAHDNYHLALDTAWFGIDGAAALIVQIARERLPQARSTSD